MNKRNNNNCCVDGCLNKQKNSKLSFFKLPQDSLWMKKWLKEIGRSDLLNKTHVKPASYKVCSIHFESSVMSEKVTRKLLPSAVPTKFLVNNKPQPSTSTSEIELCGNSDKSTQTNDSYKKKMSIDLYYTAGSAPCRLVLLVAAALNIEMNLHPVNLREGEQFKPDFLKLNPQHTVPTIVDKGFALWESRAISRYLVNKYGAESTLYPTDPQQRALVDQRLDFDLGSLYPRFAQYFYPQIFGGAAADEEKLKKLEEGLVFLNTFLEGPKYAAGDKLTLADLSLVATVSTIDAVGISLKDYPNIVKWFELVKTTAPGYKEANQKGIDEFKEFLAKLKVKTEL